MMQRLIRPIVTILLLIVSLALPITPALQASATASEECSQSCCRRKGAHCCPGSHSYNAGPSWIAARECGSNCMLVGPIAPIPAAIPIQVLFAAPVPPVETSARSAVLRNVEPQQLPSLRQRPPPLR